MDETNEQDVDLNNEDDQLHEAELEVETPTEKPKRTPEEQLAYLEGRTQRLRKKLGLVEPRKPKVEVRTGELDKADYAYFAAKGYDNDEDIEFLQSKMAKWEMNAREILKDEDVIKKLAANKIERDVRAATPGSTKRTSSGTIDNVDYWLAKYEQTGELPDNFELRSAVINAKVERESPNKPSWR